MREHLDTMPVLEAYDADCECPLCRIKAKCEEQYVETFLGGSVMEPSHRIEVNEHGFCSRHFAMMYPAGNHIVDTIQENFIDNLNKVGILLTLVPTDMQELFYAYYRETERTTDMIYLATNFHVIVDPSITYSTDKTKNHQIWNNT